MTTGVWGKIIHDTAPLEESGPSGGEDCSICCAAAVSVTLKPCGHAACQACVTNLRKMNIYRADTGVKCPYCRSYVEAYEPLNQASLSPDLHDANKAARNAAIARGGKPQQSVQSVIVPPGHSSASESWSCRCGTLNTNFRDKCSKCKQACPVTTGVKHADKKDLLKCTPEEVLQLALEKLHPSLNKAFADAGMPVGAASQVAGNSLVVGGTDMTVKTAINEGRLERLKRVIELLVQHEHVHQLIFHWFGNYTLQDLVTASSKLRSATQSILSTGEQATMARILPKVTIGKTDMLGTLIREIAKDAVDAAIHKQGTYALQKVLESPCSAAEFVLLGKELLKSGKELLGGEPGIYVMAKLVEQLSSASATDTDLEVGEEAASLLDSICELYHSGVAKYTDGQRYEKLRYDMLISCLDGALPKQNAAVLAMQMASSALEITRKAAGRFVIKSLLRIDAVDDQCRDIMSNVCCHVADAFEQSVVTTVLKADDRPPHVIACLTEHLSAYKEYEWLETITTEMIEGAKLLKAFSEAMGVLQDTLALSGISEEFFEAQLAELRKQLGNIAEFESATRKLRTCNLAKAEASQITSGNSIQDPVDAIAANGITSTEYPPLGQEAPRQNARHGAAQNGGTVPSRQAHAQQDSAPAATAMMPPDSPQQEDIRRLAISGDIPDFLSSEQLQFLQSNATLQAGKQGPPGFEQKDGAFSDSPANGIPGPSDAARRGLIAASPVRGAQRAYQPGQYSPPGTPPVATAAEQAQGPPVSFAAPRQAAPRPYMPPSDTNLSFQGLPQASGRTSPVYSPKHNAAGPAPQRPPVAAYMPHLAESATPAAARQPAGEAAKPARPAQEYYNPPASRTGAPAAAARPAPQGAAGASTDGWGNPPDLADTLQNQSQMKPFVPPPDLDHIQQRQVQLLEAKSGILRQPAQLAAQQPRAVPAVPAATLWTCPTCTYKHEPYQAGFLACAVCGSVKK